MFSFIFSFLMLACIDAESLLNYKLSEGSKRKLEESKPNITSLTWEPLRIHYEFLDNTYDPASVKFLQTVLGITTTFFQKHLLIRRSSQKITYQSSYPKSIFGFTISNELKQKEYDADLVLFINVENSDSETYLAYCGPAVYDELTLRPIFALVSWNIYYSKLSEMTDSLFENNVETAVHEIIHGLGFVDDYFFRYYDSVTGESYNTSNSYTVSKVIYLSTPRVTNFVQYHFNCTTLKGMQMENNGGSGTQGSHFERTLYYNEIMTGSDMTGNFLITDFTFELFQDTGFYRIAEYSPDKALWGKNKGCDFANSQCQGGTFSEFCSVDQAKSCSFYKSGVSKCMSEQLSGPCKYQYIYSNYDCRDPDNFDYWKSSSLIQHFGSDSICISGSVSKSKTYSDYTCIQYKCDVSNKLSLVVDGKEFDCSETESIKLPENYYGSLKCPSNPEEFCQNVDECPNSCSSKGFCINTECICMQGYSSKDCSVECTKYRYKGSCLDKCPDSTYVNENIKYCIGCPANCLVCSNYNKCTSCKAGYVLRGGFCDNYKLIELLTVNLSASNSTSNNTNSTNTNSDTNSTNTNNNSTSNPTSNSTDTSTNSTDTTSNSTDTTSNSTDTNQALNSTDTNQTSNSTDSEDSNINIVTKEELIYLINSFLLALYV
ncbi:unnamed protein product (macronuclear) [Paramecium tetraurelia]|uniref:EGF-like domain-containing protein n=1 Tax=Paramecium tetraurelia TaxID=5888 RepID=A0CPW7_PARTE|nr:uncharacterized protein GSPATT00009226001 [Paramecium tetraurelia]CAK72834.1 unnamed protein product [Paramecium tetraurelia]|eukprot:XP_001440231.1 hypothetical protein (macronuclear) [Paramecium tetraurelia strain d4-2]